MSDGASGPEPLSSPTKACSCPRASLWAVYPRSKPPCVCDAVPPWPAFICAAILTAIACWLRLEDLDLNYHAVVAKAKVASPYLSVLEILSSMADPMLVVAATLAVIAIFSGYFNSRVKRHKTFLGVTLGAFGIPGILISVMILFLKIVPLGG